MVTGPFSNLIITYTMKRTTITIAAGFMLLSSANIQCVAHSRTHSRSSEAAKTVTDSLTSAEKDVADGEIHRLTEKDYEEVAQRLGIEVAAIKAVVEVEAGSSHQGFHKPGEPLINFDISMFRKFAGRNGVNLSRYNKSHAVVFSRPNARKFGSTQAGQQARLKAARTIDETTAIQGCFWGMFQIGGFNWRKCGCSSIQEFVKRMSTSEREQLELFADFVINTGMLPALKSKNWSTFARMYNGTSYASRGYHTRLARSYAKHRNSGK